MIIGIGNDLIDIRRVEKLFSRFGDRFLMRCFTAGEQKRALQYGSVAAQACSLAKRFAAKEAASKALGTAIRGGINMTDFEITNDPQSGRPSLTLHGKAADALAAKCPSGTAPHVHIALTDEPPYAQAFVIIEAR